METGIVIFWNYRGLLFPKVVNEIRGGDFCNAQLPCHHRQLPPVIGGVVHAMVYHPVRLFTLGAIRECGELECFFKKNLVPGVYKFEEISRSFEGCYYGILHGTCKALARKVSGRNPMQPLEPKELSVPDVKYGQFCGWETADDVFPRYFFWQIFKNAGHPFICPEVVTHVFGINVLHFVLFLVSEISRR